MSEEVRKALMQKYNNPIVLVIEEKTKEVSGSSRYGFYIEYRLIHCLQSDLSLNRDVYDFAEWSCLAPLAENILTTIRPSRNTRFCPWRMEQTERIRIF